MMFHLLPVGLETICVARNCLFAASGSETVSAFQGLVSLLGFRAMATLQQALIAATSAEGLPLSQLSAVPPRVWRVVPTFAFALLWCSGIGYVIYLIFHQMAEDKQVYFCAGLLYLVSAEKEEIKNIFRDVQKTVYTKLFHERVLYADGPSQYAFNTTAAYLLECGIMRALTQYSVHDFWSGHWEAYMQNNLIYGGEPHMWSYFVGGALHLEYWAPEYDRYGQPVPRTSKLVLRARSARFITEFSDIAEAFNMHQRTRHASVPTSGDHTAAVLADAGPGPAPEALVVPSAPDDFDNLTALADASTTTTQLNLAVRQFGGYRGDVP